MDRDKLREELIRDEGLRLQAYKDSVGLWTIGVGHLLGDTARMTSITLAEAYALLEADINEAEMRARKLVGSAEIEDVRWRVLVNMAFNLGDRLGQFKRFLGAVGVSDWTSASVYMLESKWAKQVGARAIRLSRMMLTGMVI
jgi:lysozyme